ncbi:hypothetical protein [Flavobacterium sp. TBRC 19031]|uniref:hypothetical protein n=1 Tax=Flavobacterium mekongense TaxID=3379707 RepID=UPI003999C7A9
MNPEAKRHLLYLIDFLNKCQSLELSIIPWASPVLAFGDVSKSKVATLGINPSNREFVTIDNVELKGESRRFHTLSSLGLQKWSDADEVQLQLIFDSYNEYFSRNPYDGWFKKLDYLMSGTSVSYYFPSHEACHLDLIPFATAEKWSNLNPLQQSTLLENFEDTLGSIMSNSSIEVLLLNGQTVVNNFEKVSNVKFEKKLQSDWKLRRKDGEGVAGFSYEGIVSSIGRVELKRNIKVLGYNHNVQSSFGVSSEVLASIREWLSKNININSYETRRHSIV